MSRFTERFENHPIHASIHTTEELISELMGRENIEANVVEELERSKQVLEYLKSVLDNCDPSIIPYPILSSLNDNMLNQIRNELLNYRSNLNYQHLVQGNNHFDNYISTICNLSAPKFPRDIEGIRESVINFKKSASRNLKVMEDEFKRVEGIKNELEQGFSQMSSTVETQSTRLDEAITSFETQFAENQVILNKEFENWLEERKKDDLSLRQTAEQTVDATVEVVKQQQQILEADYSQKVDQYIEKLESYKAQAERIMNAISNTSMVGRYKEVAKEENDSFLLWRKISVGSMTVLCIFAIFNFFWSTSETFNWADITRRLFVAITIATFAAFSSRQAKLHLDAARNCRKMELELTSLNPYLLELDDLKRKQILAEMAVKYFGREDPTAVPATTSTPATEGHVNQNTMDTIKTMAESILSVVQKK